MFSKICRWYMVYLMPVFNLTFFLAQAQLTARNSNITETLNNLHMCFLCIPCFSQFSYYCLFYTICFLAVTHKKISGGMISLQRRCFSKKLLILIYLGSLVLFKDICNITMVILVWLISTENKSLVVTVCCTLFNQFGQFKRSFEFTWW